jgi:hypothetical protein
MNDNPLTRLYRHRLAMLVGYDQRDPPPEEVIPHWYDIHPIIVSPVVYAFAKQRGIFLCAPCKALYSGTVIAGCLYLSKATK